MFWGNREQIRKFARILLQQYEYLKHPTEICPYPPTGLDIDMTNKCNIKCISCFHSCKEFKALDLMTEETYYKILEQAIGNCERFTFGNHGENLIHPKFIDFLRMAKEYDIFVNLITNATLLTPELTEKIIDLKLDRIVFSVDSMDKDRYEKIRVGAKYDNVMQNIHWFLKKNYEAGCPVYVNISTVNTSVALGSQLSVFDHFSSLPVNVIYTSDLINFQGAANKIKDESKFETVYRDFKGKMPICMNGWDRLLIRANGDTSPCAVDWNYAYSLGNVNDDHFMNLWNNEKAKTFRRGLLSGDYSLIECDRKLCSECDAKFTNSIEIKRDRLYEEIVAAMDCESKAVLKVADNENKYQNLLNIIKI